MSKAGQNYLCDKIRQAVEYCASEYDMTWGEAIGCLEILKHYYVDVALDQEDEEDDINIDENM